MFRGFAMRALKCVLGRQKWVRAENLKSKFETAQVKRPRGGGREAQMEPQGGSWSWWEEARELGASHQ